MLRISALALAGAAVSFGALAADLPSRKSPEAYLAPTLPIFTWSGFYVGLNAGGAFNGGNGNGLTGNGFPVVAGAPPFVAGSPNGNILGNVGRSNNDGAFIGGAQAGYNWQTGALVFGVEADIQFLTRSNNGGGSFVAAPVAGLAGVAPYAIANVGDNGQRYFGTIRGRLGYAFDRTLLYVTGGYAYSNTRSNGSIAYYGATNAGPVPSAFYTGSSSSRGGFALGAGVEYALTNNWSVKGEYLYADIGRKAITYTSPTIPGTSFTGGNSTRGLHVVRLGVNYKF